MKRSISLFLVLIFLISAFFCGCKKNGNKNDYAVTNDGIINVGVLLPLSGEAENIGDKISDGLNYAYKLAPGVNINNDKKHLINLIYEDINEGVEDACEKFKGSNVSAVICYSSTSEITDKIVSSFKNESTALIFTDCNSDSVLKADNALTIGIPFSYQASVASSYFIDNGFKVGAVVSPGNDYGKNASKLFKDTFISSGGTSVSEYNYNCEDANFNANTIAGSELEFVFLVGSEQDTAELYTQLKTAGVTIPVMLSEVLDKTVIEDKMFDGAVYISKFEQDDSNYIGTDFIKSYAKMNDMASSDITTATAYGYDAYMMLYGALMSFNSNSNSLSSIGNTDNFESSAPVQVSASQVLEALKTAAHMGVTDSITFSDNGAVNTKFLYLGTVQNSNAIMLNKYNYNNEAN
ncbi:MAG: penicillin-binding protein activator [Ruminococcus sp.]|nr:penicillin-binding protein activator [Ruminococcus sp.]